MKNIVAYGKEVFDLYYGGKLTFAELEAELVSKASTISSNDFAVLGCYCETDVEATLMLHRIENEQMAKSVYQDFQQGVSIKMVFMMLCSRLQNAEQQLDRYFKCDRFAPMILSEWKTVWETEWDKVQVEGAEAIKSLTFFEPYYNKYIK